MQNETLTSGTCADIGSETPDSLEWRADRPMYTELFFPLGFPLQVRTNSEEILDAARQSWGRFRSLYRCKPLLISVVVNKQMRRNLPPIPTVRVEGRLLLIQADLANFVFSDLDKGHAWGQVSGSSPESIQYLRYYFLEATALSLISTLRAVALHAACVEWKGRGMLLCGESGAGKSSLAFACSRSGWGYVSDDASYLLLEGEGRTVTGNCHQIRFRDSATQLFTELGGRAVTHRIAGKPSIEVPTNELPGVTRTESTEIAYILFLNRDSHLSPGLRPLPEETARDYFYRFLLLPHDASSEVVRALRRLLQAQRFELTYTDINDGVEQMQRLIKDAL